MLIKIKGREDDDKWANPVRNFHQHPMYQSLVVDSFPDLDQKCVEIIGKGTPCQKKVPSYVGSWARLPLSFLGKLYASKDYIRMSRVIYALGTFMEGMCCFCIASSPHKCSSATLAAIPMDQRYRICIRVVSGGSRARIHRRR